MPLPENVAAFTYNNLTHDKRNTSQRHTASCRLRHGAAAAGDDRISGRGASRKAGHEGAGRLGACRPDGHGIPLGVQKHSPFPAAVHRHSPPGQPDHQGGRHGNTADGPLETRDTRRPLPVGRLFGRIPAFTGIADHLHEHGGPDTVHKDGQRQHVELRFFSHGSALRPYFMEIP